MAYIDHLAQLCSDKRRRLQKLEERRARTGYSTEPAILLEIEDIQRELAVCDLEINSHSKLLDLFEQYENGFAHLLHQLGQHSCRNEALECQQRLSRHMDRVREAGDTPSALTERERLVEQINALAKQTLHTSFNRLLRSPARGTTGRSLTPPPSSAAPAQPAGAGTSSITSIQNQNNVTGDHNIINNASYRNIFLGPVGSVSDDSK